MTRTRIPFHEVGPFADVAKDAQHATIARHDNAGNSIVLEGYALSNMPRETLPTHVLQVHQHAAKQLATARILLPRGCVTNH